MRACPELHDLHAFVDGQLDAAAWRRIDRHQRDCAPCRDALRSIARVNRELLRAQPAKLPDDFEDGFRESLYARMISSDDIGRLRRFQRRDLALAGSLAALVVVALTLMLGRPAEEQGTIGSEVGHQVVARAQARPLILPQTELARFLDGLGPSGPLPGDPDLERIEAIYAAADRSLQHDLADEAAVSTPDRESAALMSLARLGDSPAAEAINRHLDRSLERGQQVDLALEALIALGSPTAADRIIAAEAAGLPLARSMELLAQCGSRRGNRLLAELARARVAQQPELLAATLARIEGEPVTELLVELCLEDQTSTIMAETLAGRPGALSSLRRRAFSRGTSIAERQRAIELLGRLRDEASTAALVSLSRQREFAGSAAHALAGIGGPEAMAEVVARLAVDSDRDIVGLLSRNADLLERIGGSSAANGDYFRERVLDPGETRRAGFILALGRIGTAEDIELLMSFSGQPEFEGVAVAALALLGGDQVESLLRGLLRHRDADLRRLAREALRWIGAEVERPRAWSGFACGEHDEDSAPRSFLAIGVDATRSV